MLYGVGVVLTISCGLPYYYKACKKGDPEAKAVTVDQSPVAALANASEITGLFETISRFTRFPRKSLRDFERDCRPSKR